MKYLEDRVDSLDSVHSSKQVSAKKEPLTLPQSHYQSSWNNVHLSNNRISEERFSQPIYNKSPQKENEDLQETDDFIVRMKMKFQKTKQLLNN